jgi:hypothetical protein
LICSLRMARWIREIAKLAIGETLRITKLEEVGMPDILVVRSSELLIRQDDIMGPGSAVMGSCGEECKSLTRRMGSVSPYSSAIRCRAYAA